MLETFVPVFKSMKRVVNDRECTKKSTLLEPCHGLNSSRPETGNLEQPIHLCSPMQLLMNTPD